MAEVRETGDLIYEGEHIVNSRGFQLFTCRWLPKNQEQKALIFICHGYAMECSTTMDSTAKRLANAGFAVYGIDYEGHGKSAGLKAFVNNFDDVVNDCSDHFTTICETEENRTKKRFLFGESMGGAIALLLHRKSPRYWHGAVLVAPMCKIAKATRPPEWVIPILRMLCRFIPTWRITPTPDIVAVAFKVPETRQKIRDNQYCYKGRPPLKTAYELMRVSKELEQRLEKVSLPFIVLQGEEDKVIDKAVNERLSEVASSLDKKIKLYPDMWHGLLYGETPENSDRVFSDIIYWLEERSTS